MEINKEMVRRILDMVDIGWPCQEHDNLDNADTCFECKEYKKRVDSIWH